MPEKETIGHINLSDEPDTNLVIPRFVLRINGLDTDYMTMTRVPEGILLSAARPKVESAEDAIMQVAWDRFDIYNWRVLWVTARQMVIAINPDTSEELIMLEHLYDDRISAEDDRLIASTVFVLEWCRANYPEVWMSDQHDNGALSAAAFLEELSWFNNSVT